MNLDAITKYMTPENYPMLLGILAGVLGVVCLILISMNIVKAKRNKELQRALRSRMQAAYNQFSQIAQAATRIRNTNLNANKPEEKITVAMSQSSFIAGAANAARSDIIAYSREHLKFTPIMEHPSDPHRGKLSKPKKEKKTKAPNENGGSRRIQANASPIPAKVSAQESGRIPPPPDLDI